MRQIGYCVFFNFSPYDSKFKTVQYLFSFILPLSYVLFQVVNNWEGLKSVFKYIDRNGCASITIPEMKVSYNGKD